MAACAAPPPSGAPGEFNDPYEAANRKRHEFNKRIDRTLVRPVARRVSKGDGDGTAGRVVSNFASNLSMPQAVVNHVLQGDLNNATRMTARFLLNSTFGFGGLADIATEAGLPEEDTDFGATLHAWGVGEGAYLELPVFGPSTERDAAGMVVDLFTDPLGSVLTARQANIARAARIAGKVADRGRFGDTLDSILYDSADSYAQARLIYLLNRRDELGVEAEDDFIDPYEDIYAE
ncbi:hypothetical protein ATO11_04755 [Pseudaestuariivita atlantica]|uniref:VacJ lipoprotein n=1 Tax=Pseudaestuariivita atlantica TaxID=1317121 RepID=A0A0L1JSH0_9RHOB|nr:hypothetical protein ATO11_04755 [Pseudaestuariivita atlantica]